METKKILIASSDTEWIELIQKDLSENQLEVIITENGQDAEEKLINGSYDVGILEYFLSVKSGMEVLKNLRSNGAGTPIIIVSSNNDHEQKQNALSEGATAFFVKPLTETESITQEIIKNIN